MQLTIILTLSILEGVEEPGMYVCLCNGYRDVELRELAGKGIASAAEAYKALGKGPDCGRCLDCAQQIIDQVHGRPAAMAVGGGD